MSRWLNCPGSVALCETMPKTSSAFAEEGTTAHELAADILMGKPFKEKDYPADMVEAVTVYTDFVKKIWSEIPRHFRNKIMIEHRFNLSKLHPALFGTCDCAIYSGEEKKLYVLDYKHGAGIPVDPENNLQLMYYGLGAVHSMDYPVEEITLGIIQPRYSIETAIKTVSLHTVDLLEFQQDLIDAAIATEAKNAPTVTGDHCRFCAAKPICPSLRKQAEVAVKAQFKVENLGKLTPEVVSSLLDKLDTIETWVKGVREFAYSEAKNGVQIPGYKLVPKRATRKWVDETAAYKKLENTVNQNTMRELMTDPELKSPTQVEKILGAKVAKEIFSDIVAAISSGDTLVPDSDKREAATKQTAEQLFG